MRKYFLISAVALMAATNTMADNYLGTMEVSATITNVTEVECTEMSFGTIYLPVNNAQSTIALAPSGKAITNVTGDIKFVGGNYYPSVCRVSMPDGTTDITVENVSASLTNEDGSHALALIGFTFERINNYSSEDDVGIGAGLIIPENTPAGTYSGYVPVLITLE